MGDEAGEGSEVRIFPEPKEAELGVVGESQAELAELDDAEDTERALLRFCPIGMGSECLRLSTGF